MITPAAWQRVRALFHRALERPAAERATFLRDETAGEDEIRREIESLLAAHSDAAGFLEVSPLARLLDAELPPRPVLSAGTRLGSFEILAPLGSGGMGEVYRARDTRLDRLVAIKVVAPDLANDPRSRDRFEREARVISKLTHPQICTLHDIGSALVDGQRVQFLVMELLDGETLAARLGHGPLPLEQALKGALQILEALAAAHSLGIVHRDLKPANIMLTKSGFKLLDFGLARLRAPSPARCEPDPSEPPDSLTARGLVVGTIPYMAPEQLRGVDAEPRTDLFAFGAVFYEMLTGRRAFNAPSTPALIAAILEHDPPAPSIEQPLVPPTLDRLIAACLAKDPEDRWQHAQDVALALRGIAEGRSDGQTNPAGGFGRRSGPSGFGRAARPWRLHAAWAAAATAIALAVWMVRPIKTDPVLPPNPRPVIVLMDSPLPSRVYDPRTLAAGGTNADDVSDALRDLPVLKIKENTSPFWHREEQVREQNADLVVSHLTCLLDDRVAQGNGPIADHLRDIAQNRLFALFGYLAATNPRTRFLIYSRARRDLWLDKAAELAWTRDVTARYSHLNGRLFTMVVPGKSDATFRDPQTARLLRTRVQEILGLQ